MGAAQTVTGPFRMSFNRNGGGAVVSATTAIWDTSANPFKCVDYQAYQNQARNPDTRLLTLPAGDYICVFESSGTPNLNGVFSFELDVNDRVAERASGDCAAMPGDADRRDQFNLHVKAARKPARKAGAKPTAKAAPK